MSELSQQLLTQELTAKHCSTSQSAHSLLKDEIRFLVNCFYIEFRPSDLIVERQINIKHNNNEIISLKRVIAYLYY